MYGLLPVSRLFVTGANGCVGRILCRALSERHEVFGMDRSGEPALPGVRRGDITERPVVVEALRGCLPIDAVVHLAANARLDAPWDSVLANNVFGTFNVFDACRELGVRKLLFASTLHVNLGSDGGELATSSSGFDAARHLAAPPAPDCAYAASKVFGEAMASALASQGHPQVTCLRLGWVARDAKPPPGSEWLNRIRLHDADLIAIVEHWLDESPRFDTRIAISQQDIRSTP